MWATGETSLGGKIKKRKIERVGTEAAGPKNVNNNKEARVGAQGTQGLSRDCTSRESVFPLSRLIRDFRNKYHQSPLGSINASGIE